MSEYSFYLFILFQVSTVFLLESDFSIVVEGKKNI